MFDGMRFLVPTALSAATLLACLKEALAELGAEDAADALQGLGGGGQELAQSV